MNIAIFKYIFKINNNVSVIIKSPAAGGDQ